MTLYQSDVTQVRAEIAAAAARLIAEDGADYNSAKRKAARQILGDGKIPAGVLPDNAQIEEEVRIYNALFFADTQPARLLHLRKLALRLMTELAAFQPYLTAGVLNGTAGEHSDIYLQLFVENAKEVEIFLLNKHMAFDTDEPARGNRPHEAIETLHFVWQNEGVHLALFDVDAQRGMPKNNASGQLQRADSAAVAKLIAESEIS